MPALVPVLFKITTPDPAPVQAKTVDSGRSSLRLRDHL